MQIKIIKNVTLAFLALAFLGHFGSCKEAAVSESPTVKKIQQRGTVLVGTRGDYRPLSYMEPETGTYHLQTLSPGIVSLSVPPKMLLKPIAINKTIVRTV